VVERGRRLCAVAPAVPVDLRNPDVFVKRSRNVRRTVLVARGRRLCVVARPVGRCQRSESVSASERVREKGACRSR